jgi:hypothetical protein
VSSDRGAADDFERELGVLLNRHSQENRSNTPDFILAHFLADCLEVFAGAVRCREKWYGRDPESGPGGVRHTTGGVSINHQLGDALAAHAKAAFDLGKAQAIHLSDRDPEAMTVLVQKDEKTEEEQN